MNGNQTRHISQFAQQYRPTSVGGLRRWLLLLALLGLWARGAGAAETLDGQRIDKIEIHGIKRTDPAVVLRELGLRTGDAVTERAWQLGLTRLWNCGLFSDVHGAVETRDGVRVLVLQLDERWTLNPLFSFASGGNSWWLRLGASESNLLGQFLELDGTYERFNQYDGFSLQFRQPRLLGQRVDLWLAAERLMRPRPDYVDRRTHGRLEISALFERDRLRIGGSVDAFAANAVADPISGLRGAQDVAGAFVDASLRLGRLDALRNRQQGASVEIRPGLGQAGGQTWAQANAEALLFTAVGQRWNFAARLRAAAMGQAPVQLHYYLGGLGEMRGFVDNRLRARQYVLANLEARYVAFDSTWFAFIPAAFADLAAARDDAAGDVGLISVGGGVRLVVPAFVRTGLRFDLAVPLRGGQCAKAWCPGLSVGVYQFFY